MTRQRVIPYLLFAAALTFAMAPVFTPFNGFDPTAYPNAQVDPPVQPAGYAFAVWGLIYLWLVLSTAIGAFLRHDAPEWEPHRVPLLVSLAIGTIWLPAANYSPVLATILIWAMLVPALVALSRTPREERFLLRAPIGLYAGWLTGASWVSIGLLGAGYGIGFNEFGWAIISIFAALVMSLFAMKRIHDIPVYAFGVTWALIAIAVKSAQEAPTIALLSGLGAMVVGCAVLWTSRPIRVRS